MRKEYQLILKQMWPVNLWDNSAQIRYLQVLTPTGKKHQFGLFLSIFFKKKCRVQSCFSNKDPLLICFPTPDRLWNVRYSWLPQLKGHPAVIQHEPFKNRAWSFSRREGASVSVPRSGDVAGAGGCRLWNEEHRSSASTALLSITQPDGHRVPVLLCETLPCHCFFFFFNWIFIFYTGWSSKTSFTQARASSSSLSPSKASWTGVLRSEIWQLLFY